MLRTKIMITKKRIKEELDNCKKPLYFFHDDADGLCSFLQLYRYKREGVGIPLKSANGLSKLFLKKVMDYEPDKIFVTDIPHVSSEFKDSLKVPMIWIDHHPVERVQHDLYYNPYLKNPDKNIPASQICFEVVKYDLWIAMVGMTGDWVYDEKLAGKLREEFPDLLPANISTPQGALFESKLGELAKIFNFILKGNLNEVKSSIRILTRIKTPYEILEQKTSQGKYIYKRYKKYDKEYVSLLQSAINKVTCSNFIIFSYQNPTSFTAELSNELLYRYPNKIILIARKKSGEMKCSIRSSNFSVRDLLEKSLVNVEGKGGGHDKACGATINEEHWDTFITNLKESYKNI